MAMTSERDDQLQALLDKQAIHDCLMRYCRGIDRMDVELIKSAYHPDAWDDHGKFASTGWEFAEGVVKRLGEVNSTMHCVCNELVEVEGDVAHGEAYLVAYARFQREGKEFDRVVGARYIDRYERRSGEWKIAHRTIVHEWTRIDPVVETWSRTSEFRFGVRSRDDLVYRR